jgi:hypothetical protein
MGCDPRLAYAFRGHRLLGALRDALRIEAEMTSRTSAPAERKVPPGMREPMLHQRAFHQLTAPRFW